MSEKTQKNTVTPTPSTELTYVDKVSSLSATLMSAVTAVFDPQKITTASDAVVFINAQRNISNKFGLSSYRVLHDVAKAKLWKGDNKADGKSFTSFEEWAAYHFDLKRSQAYNAVNAGQFITPDGAHTTLKHYTVCDWSFSHLVLFAECKELYNISGKGKDREKLFKMVCDIEKAYDQNGKTVKVDGKYVWVDILDENGQPVRFITLLEKLCILGEITPEMSVKQCEKRIKEYVNGKVTDITDDSEATTDDSEATTDDSEATTDDSEAMTDDSEPAVKLTRKIVLTDDDTKDLLSVIELARTQYDEWNEMYERGDGEKVGLTHEWITHMLSRLPALEKLIKS